MKGTIRAKAPSTKAVRGSRLAEEIKRVGESLGGVVDTETRAEGVFRALYELVTDAVIRGDQVALRAADESLRRGRARLLEESDPEHAAALAGVVGIIRAALARMTPLEAVDRIRTDRYAYAFLQAISTVPGLSNREVGEQAGIADETETSRIGRQMIEHGWAIKRSSGRTNHWEITPRGAAAFRHATKRPPGPNLPKAAADWLVGNADGALVVRFGREATSKRVISADQLREDVRIVAPKSDIAALNVDFVRRNSKGVTVVEDAGAILTV
jgi:hypothetical protein